MQDPAGFHLQGRAHRGVRRRPCSSSTRTGRRAIERRRPRWRDAGYTVIRFGVRDDWDAVVRAHTRGYSGLREGGSEFRRRGARPGARARVGGAAASRPTTCSCCVRWAAPSDEITGICTALEEVAPATFDLPDPTQVGDYRSSRLLRDAVRISGRAGAGPFRSLCAYRRRAPPVPARAAAAWRFDS